jgi:hypothetical protein
MLLSVSLTFTFFITTIILIQIGRLKTLFGQQLLQLTVSPVCYQKKEQSGNLDIYIALISFDDRAHTPGTIK